MLYARCSVHQDSLRSRGAPVARSPIARSSLTEQVADHLRREIAEGVLEPGLRLDETELAARLSVSRTPVREALRLLAAEGLLRIRARRGCFVAEVTLQDQREILPILAQLEGWVAGEVATRASADDLSHLDALHQDLEAHAAARNGERYSEAKDLFHAALPDVLANRTLRGLLGALRGRLHLARHRSLAQPGRMAASLAEHRALMRALHAHDAERAQRLMREHLLRQLDALQGLEQPPPNTRRQP
jgi:DNA-binding GntR family transcriptional regulator